MVAKQCRARRGIDLSSKKEGNYKSNIGDETNQDQANNNKYLLQL